MKDKRYKLVVNFKIFSLYIMVCEENTIRPNWEGLKKFQDVYRKLP